MRVEPGTIVDRYTFESLLGRGGMAAVYLARHNTLGSTHAIKVLTLPTPAIQQRLLQEGRAQGAVKHANIVTVTDVIEVGGSPGLVMEYVEGPSLQQLLSHQSISLNQADDLARGILRGVAAAHRYGLIHRDLKPGNILLALTEDGLQPKITDFGLAKVLLGPQDSGIQTRSGLPMGTPSYMAPEQIVDAANVDQRADVWALGCILYEMVTGQRAFVGSDIIDTYRRVRDGEFVPLSQVTPDLPQRMRAAIDGALVTDPRARIADVTTLAEIWRGGESVSAGPVSAWDEASVMRAKQLALAEHQSAERPQGPTYMGELSRGSSETWADPLLGESALSLPATVDHGANPPTLAPPVAHAPEAAGRPWMGVLGVLLAAGAVVAFLSWELGWLDEPSPVPVVMVPVQQGFTADSAPQLFDDARTQEQLERGWSAVLNANFAEGLRRLKLVVEAEPQSVPALLLYERALQYSDQHGASIDMLWQAVDAAGTDNAPYAELARLLGEARRDSWDAKQGALTAFLDTHPNDYLAHLMVLSAATATDAAATEPLFERTRALNPDVALVDWLQAQRHLQLQQFDEAERALRLGLEHSPQTPALLISLGEVLLHRGQFEAARDALLQALEGAPGDGVARTTLASAWLMLGQDEDVARITEQMLNPPTAFSQQAAYAQAVAMTLVGQGRLNEASALLQRTTGLAMDAGEFTSAVVLEGNVASLYMDADMVLPMVASTDRLVALSHVPEIPDAEREQLVRNLLYARGISEVRMGNLKDGEKTLERLRDLDRVWPVFVEYLERELAIAKAQAPLVMSLNKTIPEGCLGDLELAQAGYRAGGHPQVRVLLEKRLNDLARCSQVAAGRFALAKAHVVLAEILQSEGDDAGAGAHLEAYRALWTRPDADIPLVQRVK